MEIIIERDYDAVSERCATIVKEAVARKPDLVLGLATGRTPLGLYERLRQSKTSFKKVRFFNLDELYGVGPDHPESFHRNLSENLLNHLKIDAANVKLLLNASVRAKALEYYGFGHGYDYTSNTNNTTTKKEKTP